MQEMIMKMLMGQLQSKNPQMFQMINQVMQKGSNPQDILKQMIGKSSPEQMQQVLTQAKGMGVPDDILSQIQNFK